MKVLRGRARMVAGVGLVAASAVTTTLAVVVGTAHAAEQATCTDTVNVREQPSLDAPVVGTCQTGTAVTVDDRRDNFVHLTSPAGWASAEFVTTTPDSGQPSSGSASASTAPQPEAAPANASADREPSASAEPAPASASAAPETPTE